MNEHITYEQPLNERIRSFLRLEHLFDTEDYFLTKTSNWDSRASVALLLDIIDTLSRSDVKSELIKELERQTTVLASLKDKQGVDSHRLEIILDDLGQQLQAITGKTYQPGLTLRQDELVSSIKQRKAIPGGSCNFDLPGYHYWLHQSLDTRNSDLDRWRQDLAGIKNGIRLALQIIRNSASPTVERASSGFFQKPMDGTTACQLIKIVLPVESTFFPEISGGRHRFTVRFLEQPDTTGRPIQTREDVEFELHCCIL